jgi:hypothetical protein
MQQCNWMQHMQNGSTQWLEELLHALLSAMKEQKQKT